MSIDRALVGRVRAALSEPRKVAERLGLKAQQANDRYVLIPCPTGHEKRPSCSLHRHGGSLGARCHSCGWTGDVLTLVAAVNDLDLRSDFPEVLARACELAGLAAEADDLRSGKPAPTPRAPAPTPVADPEPTVDYPPSDEVADLWRDAIPVSDDPDASGILVGRRIDPEAVARLDAARSLHPETHRERLPRWARFKGRLPSSTSWLGTGHRMLLPVYDHEGAMRSVRAWRVTADERLPKRVPPSGHRASGLVLANARAVAWLRGETRPSQIIVVEGEPDFLVRSVLFGSVETIVGIGSGSWSREFAERVPYGANVVLMTHLDDAGDRYAHSIGATVRDRARVFRWTLVTVDGIENSEAA